MKELIPLTLFILSNLFIYGQTPCGIAGDEPPGCTLCGPVYSGSTAGFSPDAFSFNYPCGEIENSQWLSFYASSTKVVVGVSFGDCDNLLGFEMVMMNEDFEAVSDCYMAGIIPGGNITGEDLNIGERYYILIDEAEGSICDFTLTVTGIISSPPPDPTGPITQTPDVPRICPGATICYSINSVNNADYYEWKPPVNTVIVSGGGVTDTEICLRFTSPGAGVVSVTASNDCFPGTPAVKPAVCLPIPPTILPPEIICPEDLPPPFPGSHEVTYQSYLGCDSVVKYTYIVLPQIPRIIDTTVCEGTCVEIEGREICNQGTTTITLENANYLGCDSIINVILRIDNDHQAPVWTVHTEPPVWQQGSGGVIDLTVNGSSPFTFNWSNGATTEDLNDLRAGEYCVSIRDANGCSEHECVELEGGIFRINPIHIICQGESKQLNIRPSRGADFQWTAAPGLSCTDCSNPIVSPSVSTIYEVKATLPGGRSGTMNVVVIVLPPPFCPNNLNTEDENGWKEVAIKELRAFEEFSSLDKNEIFKLIDRENEFSVENFIKIYPNPFRGEVQIESSSDHISQVEIYDLRGRLVYNNNFDSNKISITLNQLDKGSYFIRAKTNNSVFVYKILKT